MPQSKHRFTETTVYVARARGQSGNLLSYKTSSELNLIRINIDSLNQAEPITVEMLHKKPSCR